jgi:AraC family transcriptional regulator, transcriptional activator of pobA
MAPLCLSRLLLAMDKNRVIGYFSGIRRRPSPMTRRSPAMRSIPFREVRHDQPDDCIHYEPVSTRFRELNWTIPAHRHEGLHQFKLLTRGRVEGSIDGLAVAAEAPALFVMAPGSMHGFTYSHEAAGHQVTIPSATLRRLFDAPSKTEDWLGSSCMLERLAQADAARIDSLFRQIEREFHAGEPGRVQSLLALTTLLAVQLGRLRGEQSAQGLPQGPRDALLQRFLALVDAHHREQWSLSDYTGALGVTPDHLSRSCRALAGRGALQLLHERVLLEARRLLAYTPIPVAEIAQQLGYADAAYFSRFFRRGVGHTPSDYRQLVAQGVRAAQ